MSVFDHSATRNNGQPESLNNYKGQVLLIVNTASKCGFTPQYKELQDLYTRYHEKGFTVLAFPCDQFGHQEPGSDNEIQQFCEMNFGVSFPLFSKVDVNGNDAHPLFVELKQEAPGFLGSRRIKWNFTKFLVDRHGHVVERFGSTTTPARIEDRIAELVAKPA
ncbi:glutathione peroxidase [Alteromonas halophila]|uniref:Glutathione peroxidase n=1 Tax=Alteromonas halophila TaxID=516698 RepID=A0A918JM56_9ALTE|nr:glutathione peroxidase [Alteromonas halophila]GGW88239.1 glutathione peroxidase [Alteromonas halophila]